MIYRLEVEVAEGIGPDGVAARACFRCPSGGVVDLVGGNVEVDAATEKAVEFARAIAVAHALAALARKIVETEELPTFAVATPEDLPGSST